MNPTDTKTQEQAILDVGNAFTNVDTGGLTPEQRAAALRVQQAFTKKEATNIANQNRTDTSSFISSSESVVQDENRVTAEARALLPKPTDPGVDSAVRASNEYLSLIDEQLNALKQRRKDEEARITAQFESAKTGLLEEQKREKGATSVGLANIGGYLGGSASGTGAMLNLAESHRNEVSALEAKKASAIQQANSAIDEKEFALARLRVQEVKDIEETINSRKNTFFNQTLQLIQEERQQDKFYRDKIKEDLSILGEVAASDTELTLDPAKAQAIDEFYGVPGFTQQYLDVVRSAAKAKTQADQVKMQKDVLDLLETIPAGQEITFPDGTSYTGMGSAGDVYTSLQTDDAGIGHLVTYDKRTGQVNVSSVGQVGKTKDGGGQDSVIIDNVVAKFSQALEGTKDENGYYDPDVYLALRQELKKNYPEYLKQIDNTFLDPSNILFDQESVTHLRGKGIFAEDRSTY